MWLLIIYISVIGVQFGMCDYYNLAKCAAEIVDRQNVYSVVYVGNKDFTIRLSRNKSVTLLAQPRYIGYVDLYLLQSSTETQIVEFFRLAQKLKGWRSSTKTLLVYYGQSSLESIFRTMWSFYLTNVLVLVANFSLYTYYPITVGRCKKFEPLLVGNCSRFTSFGENSIQKFSGCPIRTGFYEEAPFQFKWTNPKNPKGIYPKMHLAIQESLGLYSVIYDNYSTSSKLPNGTYLGVLGGMFEDVLDYRIAGTVSIDFMQDFDFVPIYITDDFYYLVPRATTIQVWTNLLKIFMPEMWLAVLATFLSVLLACYFFSIWEHGRFGHLSYCTLVAWRIIFTPNTSLPAKSTFKLFVLLWNIIAYLLTSMFSCFLGTTLFIPQHKHQIDSVEKVLESGMEFGGSFLVKEAYLAMDTKLTRHLAENLVFCTFAMTCVDRVVNQRDFATVKNQHKFMYFWNDYLDEDGIPKFFWFPTEIKLMQGIYTRRGLIYKDRMQELTLRFLQSGLLQVWDKYLVFKPVLHNKTHQGQITMDHLLIAFLWLLCGLCVSMVVFIIEVVGHSKMYL